MSQAANLVEKVIGHTGNAITEQDVTNPARDRAKYADPSGETMKALCWMGKNSVKVGKTAYSPVLRKVGTDRGYSGHTEAKSCRGSRCHIEGYREHGLWK